MTMMPARSKAPRATSLMPASAPVWEPAERLPVEERPLLSHRSEPQSGKELWSLLIGDWRLTDEQPAGTLTLFNISEDPSEKADLADAHPEKAAAMSERLNAIRASLSPLPRNKVQVNLTYRLNMELQRLGYVGGEDDE